jgi:hypothetical protein
MKTYQCRNLKTGKPFIATELCLEVLNKPGMHQKIEVEYEIIETPKTKTHGIKKTTEPKKEIIVESVSDDGGNTITGDGTVEKVLSPGSEERITTDSGDGIRHDAGTKPVNKGGRPKKVTKTDKRRK